MQEFWNVLRQDPKVWLVVAMLVGAVTCLVFRELSRRRSGDRSSPCRPKAPTLDEEEAIWDAEG